MRRDLCVISDRGTEVTRKYIQVAYHRSDYLLLLFYLVILQNTGIYPKLFTYFQYKVTTTFRAQKGSISQ